MSLFLAHDWQFGQTGLNRNGPYLLHVVLAAAASLGLLQSPLLHGLSNSENKLYKPSQGLGSKVSEHYLCFILLAKAVAK